MKTRLSKCALGMALLISTAAAPFSGHGPAQPARESVTRSGAFSAAMLEHSKQRWQRESLARGAPVTPRVELSAAPRGELPPEETMGGATNCPVVDTQCPAQMTICPQMETVCPLKDTLCQRPECIEQCHETFNAGPPAGLVHRPVLTAEVAAPHADAQRLGTGVPTVTFLPAHD